MTYVNYGNSYPIWEDCETKKGCYQSCLVCYCDPCRCNPCKTKVLCIDCDYDPCRCTKKYDCGPCRNLCNICSYDPCRCDPCKSKILCSVCNYDPCRCSKRCNCNSCINQCYVCKFNPCRCIKRCNICDYDPCRCVNKCNICNICKFDPCRCRATCQCTICVRKVNFIICWFIDDNHCKGKAEQLVKSTIIKLDYLWKCRVICRREYVIRYGLFLNGVQQLNNYLKSCKFNRRCYDIILEYICLLADYILEAKCVDICVVCNIIKKFRKAFECCDEKELECKQKVYDCGKRRGCEKKHIRKY